ncbi:MAG: hypothetical protein Q7U57_05220, partial [Methylovulum sp.]|nr:hypothetical protein [Methylovulum sp.]
DGQALQLAARRVVQVADDAVGGDDLGGVTVGVVAVVGGHMACAIGDDLEQFTVVYRFRVVRVISVVGLVGDIGAVVARSIVTQ